MQISPLSFSFVIHIHVFQGFAKLCIIFTIDSDCSLWIEVLIIKVTGLSDLLLLLRQTAQT